MLLTAALPQVGESIPGPSLCPQGGLSTCPTLGRVVQGGWVGEKVPGFQKQCPLEAGISLWLAR